MAYDENNVFAKILRGEIPTTKLYEDEYALAFPDLNPDSCRKYAFAGMHLLTHKVFRLFREFGFEGSFPVMDFYLKAAGKYPVCGYVQEPLEIIDAGKPETLSLARDFLLRHGDILPQDVQEDYYDKQTSRNQGDVLPCAEKF